MKKKNCSTKTGRDVYFTKNIYFSVARDELRTCPEKHLLAAVIERALYDARSKNERLKNSAMDWLCGRCRRGCAGWTIHEVCSFLNIPAQRLRRYALQM